MTIKANRAVLAHPWLTGISQHHLAALIEELAHPWATAVEDHRHRARGGARKRAPERVPDTAWSSSIGWSSP